MEKPNSRPITSLSPKLDAKLIAYVAAGMGTLAAANPAQAKVVYTVANISVGRDSGEIPIDINGDGLPDFLFSNYQTMNARFPLGFKVFDLTARPAWKANAVVGFTSSKTRVCASALPQKEQVGPDSPFGQGNSFLLEESTGSAYSTIRFCPWAGPQSHKAYLGVKFNIGGEMHYGWIRLTVDQFSSATITGYAYETVPNASIKTGNVSGAAAVVPADEVSVPTAPHQSLGMLARGADGLVVWRREN